MSARAGDPGAAFYSGDGDAGANRAGAAKWILTADPGRGYNGNWVSSTQCDPSKAANVPTSVHGESITTLAGFSKGRLGPIYFLNAAPSRAAQINYILMFDPGGAGEFQAGCDSRQSVAPWDALRDWLNLNAANKLVIMAGSVTEPEDHLGIQAYYLRSLSAATTQKQVLVCDTGRSHENVMTSFAPMIGAPAPTSCPIESIRWNPPKPSTTSPTPTPTPPQPGPAPKPAPAPLPAGEFYVQNADGGIYWRSAPDWGTAEAVSGSGFYPGTIIKISCYQAGAANVPESTDSMWEQASWVSGPGGGSGWINEHFIEDGAALNQPSPGAGACSRPSQPPQPVDAYSNYGPATAGHAMCRGNPARPESMPGGTATQTFTVPAGVATLSSALVQIDPDSSVTAHLTLTVNGSVRATAMSVAAGDTSFSWPPVATGAGDQASVSISFTATFGKIITVYSAAPAGGSFTYSNSCPDGAPSGSTGDGLRAVVSGSTS